MRVFTSVEHRLWRIVRRLPRQYPGTRAGATSIRLGLERVGHRCAWNVSMPNEQPNKPVPLTPAPYKQVLYRALQRWGWKELPRTDTLRRYRGAGLSPCDAPVTDVIAVGCDRRAEHSIYMPHLNLEQVLANDDLLNRRCRPGMLVPTTGTLDRVKMDDGDALGPRCNSVVDASQFALELTVGRQTRAKTSAADPTVPLPCRQVSSGDRAGLGTGTGR